MPICMFFFEKVHMLDRKGIYERVMTQYSVTRPVDLARKLGVKPQVVLQWKEGVRQVPWHRLKVLVDAQGLCWDWLIEGKEPKHQIRTAKEPEQPFDRHGINERFLSLFPDCSNAKLGKELGVRDTTVFKWRHDMEQVAWERLKHAVDTKGVTWEWLLEGSNIPYGST